MAEKDTVERRTREAAHLQLIEGNPLDADDMAMFEMFDREGFSPEQQLAYVRADLEKRKLEKQDTRVTAAGRR
ncbi:MAG: hypothetical protein EOP18_02585 [Rhizobiaceae bacterium]|nr:MAG: hypothetical protein EOP18_02585 [Rhizobiaceae bacterium]